MKVVYSRQALADIDEIFAYITPANPAAADNIHAAIEHTVQRIANYPYSAQQVTDERVLRRAPLVHCPYLIYYEVGTRDVTILRVVHGARQQP